MARVVIHVEPATGVGGAQAYGAALAEFLSESNDVTLVHHMAHLTTERLAFFSCCCLDRVQMIFVPPRAEHARWFRTPLHYRLMQWRYGKEISADADVFLTITH